MTDKSKNGKKPVDEVLEKLAESVKAVFQSENYKEMLRTTAKFTHYSLNNCLLIAMQKPDATYVAGFKAWQTKFDRKVNKGEKAIRILAPSPFKTEVEKTRVDAKSGNPVVDKDGKPIKDKEIVEIQGYRVAYVFDVSQTSGKPLPSLVHDLNGSVEQYETYKMALEKVAPCPISYENIEGNAHGYYSLTEKKIVVQKGMSEEQMIKTLIHEIAHSYLHDTDTGTDKEAVRTTAEVEAESVAYTVCEHLGVDSGQYSFGYIAGWSVDKEASDLKASLDKIHDTAVSIIQAVDKELEAVQMQVPTMEAVIKEAAVTAAKAALTM